jgi:hypothetical protein
MRAATLALTLGLGACATAPTGEECDRLLAHVIELEVGGTGPSTATPEAGAAREAQKRKAVGLVGEDVRAFCRDELSREQLECGLAARAAADLERCDEL